MSSLVAIAGDDNVIVDALIDSYVIEERNGVPVAVRNVEKIFYNAQRYDDKAVSIIGYGGSISIDKVSAPGAKPVYRQWIDSDVFYKDSRICFVELPVKQGKTVKVEFHRTFKKPEQFCKITMASLYYVRNYTVEVSVPAMLVSRIKVSPYNLASNVALTYETDDKGTKTYRVSISDFRPLKNEDLAPALSVAAPALLVTGILDGLDGVYDFLKGYVPDKPIDISVKEMAEEITTGIYNDIDKAEAIASWVRQNIRYVAIEHGEWAYRPDNAENTLAKRYGDCKCSANLIKAMLCSVGIDGRFCWIGTAHTVPHDWKEVPALCSGNHCIAAAIIGDSIIYLDGTVKYCPSAYLPPSIQGRPVIIENNDNYIYATVPRLEASSSKIRHETSLLLDTDRRVITGRVSETVNGLDYVQLLQHYYSLGINFRLAFLEKFISDGNRSVSVTDASLVHGSDTAVVTAEVENRAAVTGTDNVLYVEFSPVRQSEFKLIDLGMRRLPLASTPPFCREGLASLSIPEGWEPEDLPLRFDIDNEWFSIKVNYEYDSDRRIVMAYSSFENKGAPCSLDRIDIYNKAVKDFNRIVGTWLTVRKSEK